MAYVTTEPEHGQESWDEGLFLYDLGDGSLLARTPIPDGEACSLIDQTGQYMITARYGGSHSLRGIPTQSIEGPLSLWSVTIPETNP